MPKIANDLMQLYLIDETLLASPSAYLQQGILIESIYLISVDRFSILIDQLRRKDCPNKNLHRNY